MPQTLPPLVGFLIPLHIRALVAVDPVIGRIAAEETVLALLAARAVGAP